MTRAITTVAPAKINWTLEVLGKRDDGYHEIRSVMQTIELHDQLWFFNYDEPVSIYYPHQDPPDDDLVARAAALLPGARGRIRVTKDIPDGVGLGGGSSDAAATLRGLRALGGNVDSAEIAALGTSLGSDVPFFAHGGTAHVYGRGELVEPLADIAPAWVVLTVPPIRIADKTRAMYAALQKSDFTDGSPTGALIEHLNTGGRIEDRFLYNGFERAAYEVFDGLEKYREWLLAAGAKAVHLCGAGPAMFALASGETEAHAMRARLTRPKMGELSEVFRTLEHEDATQISEKHGLEYRFLP